MDPVSHVVLGRVLVRAGTRAAWTREVGWAAGLGALSPDIDVALAPFALDLYLALHERVTHGVFGALACAAVVASSLGAWRRSLPSQAVFAASAVGALSHLAADLLAGGTVRPFWPLADVAVTNLGLVAMGDPWVIAILAGGIAAGRLKTVASRRSVALAVLTLLAAFLITKGVTRARAANVFARAEAIQGSVEATEPVWGSPSKWRVYTVYTGLPPVMRAHTVDGWSGQVSQPLSAATTSLAGGEAAARVIEASYAWPVIRNFRRAHHPVPLMQTSLRADGSARVRWSDLRYCTRDPASNAVDHLLCGLWFGGDVDASGELLRQFVQIGTFEQPR